MKKSLQGLVLLRLARDLILTDCRGVGGIVAVKVQNLNRALGVCSRKLPVLSRLN